MSDTFVTANAPDRSIYTVSQTALSPEQPLLDPKEETASSLLHVTVRPSLLSSDAPVQNYRGLYNLAGIILVSSSFSKTYPTGLVCLEFQIGSGESSQVWVAA